ncbi:MAG: helix-hairpin-helix domain-containing protein, partial [Lachnospiraceae bacterium]|nr:helix-hairpin-helix domain-containing protein [Lachnospiraceae bacterium]
PKADWAVRHLELFPIEINRADYQLLLRIPGIGVKSAKRIVKARRFGRLTFEDLKKIGVVLKRALYFITCNGKMMYPTKIEENYIVRKLTCPSQASRKERQLFSQDGMIYEQISLFS